MSPRYDWGRIAVLPWFVSQNQAVYDHCGEHGGGDPLEKAPKSQHGWHPLSTCTSQLIDLWDAVAPGVWGSAVAAAPHMVCYAIPE